MPFESLNEIKDQELIPGFTGRLIHTDKVTIAHFKIKAGSILPEHHHIHDQVSNVVEGEFEINVGGITQRLKPGSIAVIPSNTSHSGKAITDCYIIDVFCPLREDYKV